MPGLQGMEDEVVEIEKQQGERSRETRIGLVMYGGVSLAVYINGVTQEFYHAVQGNGVYHLIKELTDSEIVLDIVSGSSAGGINGILLSYALCNGRDFTQSANLWRNAADIKRLLRTPSNTLEPVRSVLDSEGYYQTELERAFRMLDGIPATGEAPSTLKELDLFVTGTDIDGRVFKRVDDAGHVVEVKDYRAVFQLKYRRGRKSNFDASRNPAVVTALSKLARITSCFPGAFAPVFVSHSNIEAKSPDRMSANELLQYWGALPGSAYFIDGGVIDNKPFTHTIREIFFRTADRKITRKLYYVEPDPERFPEREADFIPDAPSFLKPIINSLVTIPGYESIADDLKLLEDRNENIREYGRVLQDVLGQLPAQSIMGSSGESTAPDVEIPSWIPEPQKSVYTRIRYASIRDRALDGIFKAATFENSPTRSQHRTALIREFQKFIDDRPSLLRDFDVKFRLRRVFHLIYYVYQLLYGESRVNDPEPRAAYLQLLKRLNSQMELYNVISSAADELLDETDYGWREHQEIAPEIIWKKVSFSLQQLLRSEDLENIQDLQSLNRQLRGRVLRQQGFGVPNFRSVLLDADELEHSFMRELLGPHDTVYIRYLQFNAIDAYLFPMEWLSRIHEKDVIEVCRVSPLDAQAGFSRRDAATKTAGDSLAHFSAFFKRTWRSNDIMWGRLDGSCQLIESLLSRQAIAEAMNNDAARDRARARLLPGDGAPSPLDLWFKDSSEAATATIKGWIGRVTDSDPVIREQALDEFSPADGGSNQSLRELLIEMAQFQILHECLPDVFDDSIKEQVEWKQIRKADSDETKLVWFGNDVGISGAALDAVAAVGGRQLLQELAGPRLSEGSPKESALGKSFNNFRVGSEEIAGGGVPFLVVSEIVLKALLVVRSCILGSFSPKAARRIRASNLFRWFFDIPLRALYGMVVFTRSAPAFQTSIVIGVTLFAILGLFIGVKWADPIIRPTGQINFLWFGIFIIGPLAWLSAAAYQLSRNRIRDHFSDRTRDIFIAICTAAPAIFIAMVYFGLTDLVWDFWNNEQPPTDSRWVRLLQVLTIAAYGVVPSLMAFLGGYLAMNRHRQPELDDLTGALERMTEADLQDVSDRMGEQLQVTSENRRKIVKALTVSAEMNDAIGKLERAIRAVSPGALE
jgi:patatin-related protein